MVRLAKIALPAAVALYLAIVVFNNLTDYGSNYAFVERVLAMDPAKLAAVVDFFGMKMPNAHFLVWQATHNAHHRGQLSTYLRPMGAKVPSIYGGSFDEPWQG